MTLQMVGRELKLLSPSVGSDKKNLPLCAPASCGSQECVGKRRAVGPVRFTETSVPLGCFKNITVFYIRQCIQINMGAPRYLFYVLTVFGRKILYSRGTDRCRARGGPQDVVLRRTADQGYFSGDGANKGPAPIGCRALTGQETMMVQVSLVIPSREMEI